MTIETIIVRDNNKKILEKAKISDEGNQVKVIQSTLINEGVYFATYDEVKKMIEKEIEYKYGKGAEIKYSQRKK